MIVVMGDVGSFVSFINIYPSIFVGVIIGDVVSYFRYFQLYNSTPWVTSLMGNAPVKYASLSFGISQGWPE